MSETPVPEVRIEAAGDPTFVGEARGLTDDRTAQALADARLRKKVRSSRPVSAFGSSPVRIRDDREEDEAEPGSHDSGFVAGLQAAGALRELSLSELDSIQKSVRESAGPARRLNLLEAYYGAGGDAVAALRRRATDRWFVFQATDSIGAPQLIQRLLGVVPELSGAHLERVGSSSGTLVMRLGDHLCALDDEHGERGWATVSVLEVVRAMNVLLDRKNLRTRMVGLHGDGTREAYLGLGSLMNALPLVEADYLTAADAEALMGFTAW